MGNRFKSGLFCLIFAFAVITSCAEKPEEPDTGANEEYAVEVPNRGGKFDGSSARVKRDWTPDWLRGNPLAGRGRSPPGGPGRLPPGGRGRPPMPLPINQRPLTQRQIDIQRLHEIQNFFRRMIRLHINSGLRPEMARVRAVNDNPVTMREFRMLERRNPDLDIDI